MNITIVIMIIMSIIQQIKTIIVLSTSSVFHHLHHHLHPQPFMLEGILSQLRYPSVDDAKGSDCSVSECRRWENNATMQTPM